MDSCEFRDESRLFRVGQTLELFLALRYFNQGQTFDDFAVFEMFFDDLRNVIGLDLAIPDTFGIDEDGDADRAKADRAAIRQTRSRPSGFGLFSLCPGAVLLIPVCVQTRL